MARRSEKSERLVTEALRRHIRTRGEKYLDDPNITSIGVGRKNGDGEICLVFTVGKKVDATALESLGSREIPSKIEIEGLEIATDVCERCYQLSFKLREPEANTPLKMRIDPVFPGASVSHIEGTAGTLGMIVFDNETGAPCILSNWHVLHGNSGEIGDPIVQPGPFDDNNVDNNFCGTLLRSHLGPAGDCALAKLEDRGFEREIYGIGVVPSHMADVELDDRVVKTGRTTETTFGIVSRTDVLTSLDYGGQTGMRNIGCFEISPDPDRPAANGEISMGGDSGSAWMIVQNGKATDIFAGLHFAGEARHNPNEYALACYPASAQKKLNFSLTPTKTHSLAGDDVEATGMRNGYDDQFLGLYAPMPTLTHAQKIDAVNFGNAQTIPYTHFSVCLSAKRKLARFSAWNIDGARRVTTSGGSFKTDPRIDTNFQTDNALYKHNKLDRGHIARRADLTWGSIAEARQADKDSYYYTNIAPQHESFNQSRKKGIWGRLENLILEQAATKDIRASVIAGPVFDKTDPMYRGTKIPRQYWKLIAYRNENDMLAAACFLLSQNDLLSDIETLDFDKFRLFQLSVSELARISSLDFNHYLESDVTSQNSLLTETVRESLPSREINVEMRELLSESDVAI